MVETVKDRALVLNVTLFKKHLYLTRVEDLFDIKTYYTDPLDVEEIRYNCTQNIYLK